MSEGGPAGIWNAIVRPGNGAPRFEIRLPTPWLMSMFATQPGAPMTPRSKPTGENGGRSEIDTKHRPRLTPVTLLVVRLTSWPRTGFVLAVRVSGAWSVPD